MNATTDKPLSDEDAETTITRALTDAERASIAAAREAHEAGRIAQREVAPGVWKLTHGRGQS